MAVIPAEVLGEAQIGKSLQLPQLPPYLPWENPEERVRQRMTKGIANLHAKDAFSRSFSFESNDRVSLNCSG